MISSYSSLVMTGSHSSRVEATAGGWCGGGGGCGGPKGAGRAFSMMKLSPVRELPRRMVEQKIQGKVWTSLHSLNLKLCSSSSRKFVCITRITISGKGCRRRYASRNSTSKSSCNEVNCIYMSELRTCALALGDAVGIGISDRRSG